MAKTVKKAPAKRVAKKAPAKRVAKKAPAKRVAKKAPAKRVAKKAPAKRVVKKAPAKRVAKKAPAKRVAKKASSSRANVVIPEVPLKGHQSPETLDLGKKYGFETGKSTIPEVPSSKGEVNSKEKNLKVVFVIVAALAVAGVAVSVGGGSSSNSPEMGKEQVSNSQISESETKPAPSPSTEVVVSTETPNTLSEFPIAYLYNSTGIRIFFADDLSIPDVQKTSLLISKNGATYENLVSGPGEVRSFRVIKVDTVGQSKFIIKLKLEDGAELQSRPLMVPGDFSLT